MVRMMVKRMVFSAGLGSLVLMFGCPNPLGLDVRPDVPRTASGQKATVVAVNPADAEEVAAVGALQEAESRYHNALQVLNGFYTRQGVYDKQIWTENELKNLDRAQTFRFEGLVPPEPRPPADVSTANEPALVEQVLVARQEWQRAVAALLAVYEKRNLAFKADLMRSVQKRYDPVRVYDYVLEAEIPPADLKPTVVVPEAEQLFQQAKKLYGEGALIPLLADYRKERQALNLFRQLIKQYPSSTRIGESAFYIGQIYKEYFNEHPRAVTWYERAVQWDPNMPLPARFQAAVLLDYRLAERAKALHYYREAIKHEQFNQSNVNFADRRIKELLEKSD